jgi:hypothetical protein
MSTIMPPCAWLKEFGPTAAPVFAPNHREVPTRPTTPLLHEQRIHIRITADVHVLGKSCPHSISARLTTPMAAPTLMVAVKAPLP